MNLQEYLVKYGTQRLVCLAILAGVSPGHILNLAYTVNSGHDPVKTPSMKLARKLVILSLGELTMEGLANPVKVNNGECPRVSKAINDWFKGLNNA